MKAEEKSKITEGATIIGLFTGAIGYLQYREYTKKNFERSRAHYKMNAKMVNCTPWTHMYFTWWRMPEREWTIYHKFKPYFVLGQLDISKEVLIPRTKVVGT